MIFPLHLLLLGVVPCVSALVLQRNTVCRPLGCYVDSVSSRLLSSHGQVDGGPTRQTITACQTACLRKNLPFAGVEFGSECYCGASFAADSNRALSGCDKPCAGDPTELCGGSKRIFVYDCGEGQSANTTCPAASTVTATITQFSTITQTVTGTASASTCQPTFGNAPLDYCYLTSGRQNYEYIDNPTFSFGFTTTTAPPWNFTASNSNINFNVPFPAVTPGDRTVYVTATGPGTATLSQLYCLPGGWVTEALLDYGYISNAADFVVPTLSVSTLGPPLQPPRDFFLLPATPICGSNLCNTNLGYGYCYQDTGACRNTNGAEVEGEFFWAPVGISCPAVTLPQNAGTHVLVNITITFPPAASYANVATVFIRFYKVSLTVGRSQNGPGCYGTLGSNPPP